MSYWEERSFELTKEIFQDSEDYVKFLHKEYQTSMNVLNNELSKHMNAIMKEQGMSIEEARKAIKEYEVEGLKSFVQKAKGTLTPEIEKELSFASRHARISRIQAMELEIKATVSSLMDTEEKGLFAHLSNAFEKKYYHELYNLGRLTGYEHTFGINRDELRNIILHPWAPDGSDFSQRIWGRGDKLVDSLRRNLTQNIMRGRSPDEAIADISKTMNVSRVAAGRLVMTESAAINSKATQETYIRMRIKKYEIVATLDLSTSEICQGLDSKVFDTEHYAVGVTAPPFHPNCRSTTVPFFDDDIQKKLETSRIARNPETGKNERIENLSYKEWFAKYVDKQGLTGYTKKEGNGLGAVITKPLKGLRIDLQLFANKDLQKQTDNQLRKGIRSNEKQIRIHEDKINNPEKYIEDWNEYSERRKEGLKKHWRKEISNFNKNISDNLEELRKRGVEVD